MGKKVEIQIDANRPKLGNRKGIRVENYSKPACKKEILIKSTETTACWYVWYLFNLFS